MDVGLPGRRALITGGSKGIGLAIARSLAAEGAAGLSSDGPAGSINPRRRRGTGRESARRAS